MSERARAVFVGMVLLVGCSSGASSGAGPAADDSVKATSEPSASSVAAATASGAPAASATSANSAAAPSVAPSASASASAAPPAERKACPGWADLPDLGDVSNGCHVHAATSKGWLQQDLVSKPCQGAYAAATGCVELAPDGCDATNITADGNAFGGSVLVFETGSGYYFYGADGKARFAVATGCQSYGLVLGEGRFVLGARAVESDGVPHYGRVTGISSYPNAPQLLNMPPPYQLPRIVSSKADIIGGVARTVNGKRESKIDDKDAMVLLEDFVIIKASDGTHLDVMKIGSPQAAIVTPPAGTIIVDFDTDTPGKRIGWVEKKGEACEVVVAKFAETADKIDAKRLGAVPCGGISLATEWLSVDRTLVHLADSARKQIPPCEGPRCGAHSFTLISTSNAIISVTHPNAIQAIPIASLPADATPTPAKPL